MSRPPNSQFAIDPLFRWVVVVETTDRVQFAMAKGLIEDAGIPLFVDGAIGTLVQDIDGFLHKRLRLQVPDNREADARQVLRQLVRPVPPEDPTDL